MAPRLPRIYWGEIIYATPGSGKTYVAGKYDDVWDSDDLIVEVIEEITNFDFSYWGNKEEVTDRRVIISAYFRYIKFNHRKRNRIYQYALAKMKEKCRNNDVVLLGTRDLMHEANRVFIQKDDSIVRNGFKSSIEEVKVDNLPNHISVHYINEYLDNSLQRVCKLS
jgi:hypothetical protein